MVLSRSSSVAFWLGLSGLVCDLTLVSAYNNSATDNLAVYWGQDSYGAAGGSSSGYQQNLSYYCQDDVIDALPMAFLNVFFGTGGEPSLDLANTCSTADDPVFEGTELPDCSFLASDIQTCQSAGKIVTMSLGGATGSAGFSNSSQAQGFAQTIWDLLLGGSSSIRPFGDAVLDGIDLDIEGGSSDYFTDFVSELRSLMDSGSKTYYLTAAPQCPFPDAYIGSVINAESFDAIYVQFYNNYCELTNYDDSNDWDYSTWDNWAKNTSPNPDVKIYIGAPASSTAASTGYVDAATLGAIAQATREQYSSFGGVMLWDASQAYANDRYDAAIKSYLTGSSVTTVTASSTTTATTAPTTSSATETSTTAPATTTTAQAGDCAGVSTWVANVAYTAGDQVVYNGELWTANWWSYADTPGGASGDWTDDGACSTTNGPVSYQSKEVPLTATARAGTVPNLSLSSAIAAKTADVSRRNSRFFQS
ncbi:carbohydrate-binding module family 5 protein [Daedalea quercina L-15889]|uniref:chitinase n=1 Tax=Daedalea quercina L-15889 TaxID=1314783 RepID=A0A165T7G4_9APHY|nr:carbohydrate-binding module family 5 protein [Daedalea quercina L-15889]